MMRKNIISRNCTKLSLFLFIIFLSFSQSLSQTNTPSITSNINSIKMFSENLGVLAADQIYIIENSELEILEKQPPLKPQLMEALGMNSIFITSNTDLQESQLFYWNGKHWEIIYHPIVNNISAIHFNDKSNGILCGLGEIAILQNGKWKNLIPPTNKSIIDVVMKQDTIVALTMFEGIFIYTNQWRKIKNSEDVKLIKKYNDKIFILTNSIFGKLVDTKIQPIIESSNFKDILAFDFKSNNEIIYAGLRGKILKIENKKVELISSNTSQDLKNLDIIKNNIWIVGNDATIIELQDDKILNHTNDAWKGFEQVNFYSYSKIVDDGYGVIALDFNDDGKSDIFTCGLYENNHLYINKGDFQFKDEAIERGVSGKFSNDGKIHELNLGACAGDFDNDGNIDLYVSSLNTENKLYHNLGDGNFVDYTNIAHSGGNPDDRSNSVITGDVNNDGSLDLFICNENSPNQLLLNNGAGVFSDATNLLNDSLNFGGTGASFADIDNDGDIDLFIANWSTINKLYKNLFIETGQVNFIDFTDSASIAGLPYSKSNAVVFADIDNDADLDLFVTNRKTQNNLYLNNGLGLFKDVTEKFLGLDSLQSYGAIISDFDSDGYKDLYVANVGKNTFYKNINGVRFQENSKNFNANISGYSTGLAVSDFDNDKQLDIYLSNYIGSSSTILRNKKSKSKTVTIKIECFENNRSAIGTKIYVYRAKHINDQNNLIYFNQLNGGSGYGSMSDLTQTVPCSDSKNIDVKIIFPNGKTVIRNYVLAGSNITITDVNYLEKRIALTKNFLFRLFNDSHRFLNFIKLLIVIFLISLSLYFGKKKYNWSPTIILSSTIFIIALYSVLHFSLEFKEIFYSSIIPLSTVLIILGFLHLSSERKLLKQETELEKEKLREKLSRDLHDDLASTLSSATIYLELLKQSITKGSNEVWQFFDKTNQLLINSKQTITDLIWTIKPNPESISDFVAKVRDNFIQIFKEKNIQLNISENNLQEIRFLNPIEKHNIYLIIKEGLNNILKHSRANKVNLNFTQKGKTIEILISDNGKGFEKDEINGKGNGLNNIVKRCNEMDAVVNITSEKSIGTKIHLIVK